jgi:hypothetical protein
MLGLPPAEGRAPHARKEDIAPIQTLLLFGHHPIANPSVTVTCPGLLPARIFGRTECVPPRKPPSRHPRAFLRKAVLACIAHPRGGAGSARPQGRHGLDRGVCPGGHGPLASSSGGNEMPRHPYGGTMRARRPRPSEKTPSASSPTFPRTAIHAGLVPPRRGGLRTPAMTALASRRPLSFGNRPFAYSYVARKRLATRMA